MKVSFEHVLDGINRYVDREIYSKLNNVQELFMRIVFGRINQNSEIIKNNLMNNGFVKTLCIIDSDGMVDVERLLQDVRREIERQGSIEIEIPFIGKLTFSPADVDSLHNEIVGRNYYENY